MSDTQRPILPPPPSQRAVPRPMWLGRYQLLKKIGIGGMAEIWVARTAGISGVEKICVVKRILPHLADSPAFVRMFLDEARIAATLNHPNLVQMYGVEEIDGVPVIAMEYLHGEDLRNIKKELKTQNKRMPIEHAMTIGIGIAAGLHYAHEKVGFDGAPLNIIHRDVSPHNVIVTYEGGVKILDFGIAKAANRSNETRDGALKGKIPYMSPEQCESERLDRRTDIYSAGLILYELTTGNSAFRRGATEFEIMRAIVEETITPPSKMTIDYPEALERILLKCLAKNRADRYASARELQVDLEAFARDQRLQTSALALSSFMAELLGERIEAWRDALAQESDFPSEPSDRPISSDLPGDDSVSEPRGEAPPQVSKNPEDGLLATRRSGGLSAAPAQADPAAADAQSEPRILTVTKRKIGNLVLVSLSGRMTEAFQGQALAREISGRVLFDLAGVERVTSFGVREWLQMLNEAIPRVHELYIGRCSEPMVNQVSMIRRFVGDGRIVSFYGAYRCESCGGSFDRLFDCERDADVIRSAEPPPGVCPRCGGVGAFDDDAEGYFAFAAPFAGVSVPPDVRAVLDDLAKADAGGGPGDAIEKIVDERGTQVRVGCKLDATVRWKRILDGIEGSLSINLGQSTGVTSEGARGLALALRALGDEVKEVRLQGCPQALIEHLIAATPPLRVAIVSALVEARCESCNAMRGALLDIKEGVAAALEDREPYVPCKRCNAPLSMARLLPLLRRLGGAEDNPPRAASPVASEPATIAEPKAPFRRGGRAWRPAISAVVLAAVAVGVGLAHWSGGEPGSTSPAGAAPAMDLASAASASGPPAWTTVAFLVEGDQILVAGRGVGATKEGAVAVARNDALVELMAHMVDALAGTTAFDLLQAGGVSERRAETAEAEVRRYLQQVGAFATPERVEARFQEQHGSVTAIVRYRLPKADYDAAVQFYRRTANLSGLTAAPIFPALERKFRTKGELVVVAVDENGPAAAAGIRVGDIVLTVNGRSVSSLEAFESAAQKLSDSGLLEVDLESGGVRRSAKIPRLGGKR